jgi:hypothetical protein
MKMYRIKDSSHQSQHVKNVCDWQFTDFLKLFPDEIVSLFYNVHLSWGTGIDWFIHSCIHLFIILISFIHTIHSFIHSSFVKMKHKNLTSYIWKYCVPFSEVQMWNKQLYTRAPNVCKGLAMHKPSTRDTHLNGAVEIIRNNGLGSRATYISILSLNVLISV